MKNHNPNILSHIAQNIEIFQCPACKGDLSVKDVYIYCIKCGHRYSIEEGIPLLFLLNNWEGKKDVTELIKVFYEGNPFPNYDEMDNVNSLIQKAERGVFANMLNQQIPFNVRILEVGCGTGQLVNYLGIAYRTLFGTDICLNSLKLANDFKIKNNLERVGFYQMNLFKPIFKKESFHLVICNGVLHHTSDPYEGFRSIARLVKKDGYILLGLYNKYGRLIIDIRRLIFSISGERLKFLDSRLRTNDISSVKKLTWFKDQYKNPHESKHTIGEVLSWFSQTGFEFRSAIPSLKILEPFTFESQLFTKHPYGNRFDHLLVQLRLIFTGSKEGGFFILIGKKISSS